MAFGRKGPNYPSVSPAGLEIAIPRVRERQRAVGRYALGVHERWLIEAYTFEAYVVHQGGFDYYFAHFDEPERWADAA